MSDSSWATVDRYLVEQYLTPDPILVSVLKASEAAGLPAINVSPTQGKLFYLYARMIKARRILEIGTLGGYSAICFARALPADGKLVTLEVEPHHADVARNNFVTAGVSDRIDLRVGRAIDILPKLHAEKPEPFDLIFIDADKISTADYFQWALKLSHPGTVVIVDNVVRDGKVADTASTDASVLGIQRFTKMLREQRGVSATAIQTVGGKGYDGFAMILMEGDVS